MIISHRNIMVKVLAKSAVDLCFDYWSGET